MNVFLLEDDAKVAEFLQQGLSEEGWRVTHVSDGLQALDVLFAMEHDVLVLDIMVPHLDGLSVLKKIRSRENMTPVLLLTARDAV